MPIPDHLVDAVLATRIAASSIILASDPQGIAAPPLRGANIGCRPRWCRAEVPSRSNPGQGAPILEHDPVRCGRKVQETFISFWLEAKLGKEEIPHAAISTAIYLRRRAHPRYSGRRPGSLFRQGGRWTSRWKNPPSSPVSFRAPSALQPAQQPRKGARERAAVVLGAMVAAGRLKPRKSPEASRSGSHGSGRRPCA